VSVAPFPRVFTVNHRAQTEYQRFAEIVGAVAGRRLTWAEAIGQR
jgi:hypothetical protein